MHPRVCLFSFADESDDSNESPVSVSNDESEASNELPVSVSSTAWELPDSVIHEILLKLPLKSIIRFKRVCKAWYDLILDPYFANAYFSSSPLKVHALSPNLKFSLRTDLFSSYVEISKKRRNWNYRTCLVGSCDGLLCLVETLCKEYDSFVPRNPDTDTTVCIFNPLIREYIGLPYVGGHYNDCVVYGFGSTVDGNHYKVVRVAMKSSGYLETRIFTIGVDKNWRKRSHWLFHDENCHPSLRFSSHGVALRGVLHWVGGRGDVDTSHNVIYVFDVLKEKGQYFKLTFAVGRKSSKFSLGVWDGNLCITDSNNELQIDIWTMKQYGDMDSWSKTFVLISSIQNIFTDNSIPIKTMRNGHLMISCRKNNRMFSLDPKRLVLMLLLEPKKRMILLEEKWSINDSNGSPSLLTGYGYSPSFISPRNGVCY